jgi:sec-independent protein translocase protein TatA
VIGDILQPTHLLFILVIALLVLGPKRLPEVGRSLGKGMRDFRHAISGQDHEDGQPAIQTAQNGETPVPEAATAPPMHEAATAPPMHEAATVATPVHEPTSVSPPVPVHEPTSVSPPAEEPASVSGEHRSTGSD